MSDINEAKAVKPQSQVQKQSADEMDAEIKAAELKLKQLEIEEKKANLQDLQERLAEREMKRQNKIQRSVINGNTLRQLKANDEAAQKRCNHHKGGNGAHGVVVGQGDDPQYAVMKHQFANGDIWVRCLRCGKTWKPPLKENFTVDGKFDELAFMKASVEYETALQFQTRNVMSTSIQFRFSDNGANYRQQMKDVTLR